MKKLEKAKNREVARVLLIEASNLIDTAHGKLNDIGYVSSVERKFEDIEESIHSLLTTIVIDQANEN